MKEIEGTWEEIARHIEELKDRRLRVTKVSEKEDIETGQSGQQERNWAMYYALKKVKKIQQGMRKTPSEHTLKIIREGRSGGMYGYEPSED